MKCGAGEIITFSYDFQIPENLEYGNSLYTTFGTYFANNDENAGVTNETSVADVVGLATGEGPKIDVSHIIVGENGKIQEGQNLKVLVTIENTGDKDLEDVIIREYIPQYARYTEYQEGSGNFGEVRAGYIFPETKQETGTNKEYIDIPVGTVKAGDTAIVDYLLYIDGLPKNIIEFYEGTEGVRQDENGKFYLDTIENGQVVSSAEITEVPDVKLTNQIAVKASNLENDFVNESNEITVKKSAFKLSELSSVNSNNILRENDEIIYTINVRNITENTLENVVAQKIMPEGLYFKEAYIEKYNENTDEFEKDVVANYDINTKTVTWSIGQMQKDEIKKLKVIAQVANFAPGKYEREIKTNTEVVADGVNKSTSLEVKNTAGKENLQASIEHNVSGEYISEGDSIIYTIKVKNTGKLSASNVSVEDILPDELRFLSGSYVSTTNQKGTIRESENKVKFTTTILPDEEFTVTIKAEAKDLPNNEDEKVVKNSASVIGTNGGIVTNEITVRIEQAPNRENPTNNGTSGNGGTSSTGNGGTSSGETSSGGNNAAGNGTETATDKTFKIRGTAWIDANGNGARETSEQLLEGIETVLVKANTGEIVKDKTTCEEKKTKTATDGSYSFENLESGDYIVVLYYNNQIYKLTAYKKNGVADNINSDFIASKVKINGEEKDGAISDTIRLSSSSFANIDMGLVYANQFDLKLEKFVTKVTVQNKEGVKTYNYNDAKIGKVDLTAKQMVGSTVLVEYKIKDTKEGNVAGYAKNIVDYMPSQMKFNSTLNPNWYAGNDGNLYTTALTNTVINPNESKELSLILTKQVTNTNSSIINNLAEIYEDYNELGVQDRDSKIKNKAQGEDDLGSADFIISIKTGAAITYTVSILVALVVLAGALYVIRQKYGRYYN